MIVGEIYAHSWTYYSMVRPNIQAVKAYRYLGESPGVGYNTFEDLKTGEEVQLNMRNIRCVMDEYVKKVEEYEVRTKLENEKKALAQKKYNAARLEAQELIKRFTGGNSKPSMITGNYIMGDDYDKNLSVHVDLATFKRAIAYRGEDPGEEFGVADVPQAIPPEGEEGV